MSHHFIIVANGCFSVKEIIVEAVQDKIIVALDGAADKLARLGILPTIILGDFDSYTGNIDATIVPKKNQNLTDLVKAIHYCDAQDALSITLICALGGRLDHHEAAMRSLRSEYKKARPMLLHSEQQTLRFAKDENVVLQGEIGDKCGIFAFPAGRFSSHGLLYDVQNYELNMGFSESVANTLRSPPATLSIAGEALIIMPPQLSSQRDYMNKTEVERLEMLLRDARLGK